MVIEDDAERALMRKVTRRLIPFLFFLYIIAYLDRVNVGFAKLHMNTLPWFSESVYGFGAGIFFIGYFLFEVPSNILLQRFGARKWIARIMITWGIIAMGMLFVNSAMSFYVMRFLLGVAEAGFFPGVLLYLTFWFTAKERAKVVALFMTANAVTFSFGGPISGILLDQPERWGLAGYQQLFLFQGLPAVLLAFVVLWYLPNGPQDARWLSETEKERLAARLAAEHGERPAAAPQDHGDLKAAFANPAVWLLCAVYFCLVVGMYGISLWVPQLVKNMGYTDLMVGVLCAIPYIAAGTLMVWNAVHSDKMQERRFHVMIPATLGALGLILYAVFEKQPVAALASLALAAGGMWATLGPFWAMAPMALRSAGTAALAGGFAIINSVGNLGGFIGPYTFGFVKDRAGSFTAGVIFLACSVLLGGLLALIAGRAAAGAAFEMGKPHRVSSTRE
jgi:MFS transporter, ACS family, tartrate transporter